MRFFLLLCCCLILTTPALAKEKAAPTAAPSPVVSGQIEVTADESLEWYQDQRIYVARGNAKAVRGTMTVEADILTAHERDKAAQAQQQKDKVPEEKAKPDANGAATTAAGSSATGGNIDKLTAEGHVHITDPREQVFGDHGVYDLDLKVAKVTGSNLKYLTAKDVVTARDSLEYYENESMAIARGKAVAVHEQRHVEGDVLTAYFTKNPQGQQEMSHMTAEGHVTVITATDVSRGDHAVYDVKQNTAVLTGHVRVTRQDTQLTGDKAEVDFTSGQSRLLNEGHGRVRALLLPKNGAPKPGAAKVDKDKKDDQKAALKVDSP
jgi:lipopolysaccharide export system protein LptA